MFSWGGEDEKPDSWHLCLNGFLVFDDRRHPGSRKCRLRAGKPCRYGSFPRRSHGRALGGYGKLFFAKGYGYADVKNKKPVLPDRTLFRIASVSKLFTWTAVMQLVEQGKLDLNVDVNSYLKEFKIPPTFPEPITLGHMMSHSAGFEDIMTYEVRTPQALLPLQNFLAQKMPTRVWPPGRFSAYSNYSTALAGYIVQQVSGIPFEEYIEQNIYKPLGMGHSTFRQPLPASLAGDMSIGYSYSRGAFKAEEFELLNGDYPAGSMSTSATDIARFMIAHLQNGQYEGNRILQEETAKLMHTRLFSHDARTNGNAHGFWESRSNGLAMIEHGGDISCFHTLLTLIPEKNAGFFVSYNSTGSSGMTRYALLQAFLNRYYPGPPPAELKPNSDFKTRAKRFTGVYEMNRRSFTQYAKLVGLIASIKVSVTPEATLLITLPMGLGESQWIEVDPGVFHEMGGQETLIFREDGKGRVTHAFHSKFPEFALVKLEWYQWPIFHIFLIVVTAVLFLTAALGWPIGALSRVLCKRQFLGTRAPRAARWLAGGMSALLLLFLLGLASLVMNTEQIRYGVPLFLKIILAFPIFAAVLGIGVFIFAVQAWRKKYWTGCGRIHYTLVLFAAVVFFWFLKFWNLFGWKY